MSTETQADKVTLQDTVNDLLGKFRLNDNGKWQLPEEARKDVPEAVILAVTTEKRRRDTQSALTKVTQENKALTKTNTDLMAGWQGDVTLGLSQSETADLVELKATDPDAWKAKLDSLEAEKLAAVTEKQAKIANDAAYSTELSSREVSLDVYNEAHPDMQLTDAVIADDIPPRITNKLAQGTITFDEFLAEAGTYLAKPKKVQSEKPNAEPNLGNAAGGSSPTEDAQQRDATETYENTTF